MPRNGLLSTWLLLAMLAGIPACTQEADPVLPPVLQFEMAGRSIRAPSEYVDRIDSLAPIPWLKTGATAAKTLSLVVYWPSMRRDRAAEAAETAAQRAVHRLDISIQGSKDSPHGSPRTRDAYLRLMRWDETRDIPELGLTRLAHDVVGRGATWGEISFLPTEEASYTTPVNDTFVVRCKSLPSEPKTPYQCSVGYYLTQFLSLNYLFPAEQLPHWREIDQRVRALVLSFME